MNRAEISYLKKNKRIYFFCLLSLLFVLTACKSSQKLQKGNVTEIEAQIISTQRVVNREETGVNRIVSYQLVHEDIPVSFDGVRIAFITDLHYPSYFKSRHLTALTASLDSLNCDMLCLGGDFHENTDSISHLFKTLSVLDYPLGAYGVLGNNDYESGYEIVVEEMTKNGFQCLEHQVDTIWKEDEYILIAGVKNPFDLKNNGESPTLGLSDSDYVILLTHTPDYAEDVPITHTDLVLAGHTHGGQVTIFGFAPIVPSKYDQRFLKGLVYNSKQIPMIVSTGIGTSNADIRLGAPSEIIVIELKSIQ